MNTNEIFNILDTISKSNGQGMILTKSGSLCLSFQLSEPESYSLSRSDIDERNRLYLEAYKFMPSDTYVHKQDIYLEKLYRAESGQSFLDKADDKHFRNREYIEHKCILHFVLSNLKSLEKAYVSSVIEFKENLHIEDREKLETFLEAVNNVISILKNLNDTELVPLTEEEMRKLTFQYCQLFTPNNEISDIHVESALQIGDYLSKTFAICDESFLPENTLSTFKKDSSLPMANADLYEPVMEDLGMSLPFNHIVNQIIYFEGNEKLREEVSRNIAVYGSNSSMHKKIRSQYEQLEDLQTEIYNNNEILVRTFFSICLFCETFDEVKKSEKIIKERLNMKQFKYYVPGYDNLVKIHLGCMPGQVNMLPKEYLFLSTLPVACAMYLHCSQSKNDNEGIMVHDRMYQVPLRKDVWDAKKKRVNARNGMIIAGTGGGKSAFTLNLAQQLIEQDYVCIVVEFGKSFSQLCKLYSDISLHIDYDGQHPLGINPFDLDGSELDNNNLEMLSGIVQRYWKHMFTSEESEKEVALTRIIQDYYEHVQKPHNFQGFYEYVTNNYHDILKRKDITEKFFDIESFKLNCGEFMPGQRYENVCKDTRIDFNKKKFIVFELTQIKQDRFLSNLVMSMIFTVIQKKLLSDRRKRGILIFDEYAETAQMKDTATGTGIHSSVAFCYQKIRKENGAVYTIVQTPDQLPDDENTKNIISNTDMLYVLPTKEVIYDSIINKFKFTKDSQIALMKSMRNNFTAERPYSECFMRFGENYATVTRLEFSKEKFLAFQTEGEIWSELEELSQQMPMEKAIESYIKKYQHRL